MLLVIDTSGSMSSNELKFQRAPTLGGECYPYQMVLEIVVVGVAGFNGHPPLGVNATELESAIANAKQLKAFQRAPTLGGECYGSKGGSLSNLKSRTFQRAPTLGGECYTTNTKSSRLMTLRSFNRHPPLGVNATAEAMAVVITADALVSTGTHPWG